jgi:hypothetical protein
MFFVITFLRSITIHWRYSGVKHMRLKITEIQMHHDESNLLYTVTFDDFDRARCFVVTLTESAFFDSAAHPFCEAIDIELEAEGKIRIEKYDTEALVRLIKKFIRDEANRESPE